jgi:hypothetical protein
MLKIRDGVDLKELEKFGFKPKYDENTGELIEYYKEYCEELENARYYEKIGFHIIKKKRLFVTKRECCGGLWDIFSKRFGDEIMNLIYDLIKKDLVEKV